MPELVQLSAAEAAVGCAAPWRHAHAGARARAPRRRADARDRVHRAGAVRAFPQARLVHMLRDGRDVVCSLLEKGWLGAAATAATTPASPTATTRASGSSPSAWTSSGTQARRAVAPGSGGPTCRRSSPPGRRRTRSATRRWRPTRLGTADGLAAFLEAPAEPLAQALRLAHAGSIGRFRRDLTPAQLADVEAEAGGLLAELGYA